MTASSELTTKKEQIKQLLTDFHKCRDSDRNLCCEFWYKELKEHGLSQCNFLRAYDEHILTSADSISRLKRLIQKEHPELRGINKYSEQEKCRELFTGELNFPNQ